MPLGIQKVDVKKCAKTIPPHPCDPPKPCDPFFQLNDCPEPYICQERLKNPAWPGEISQVFDHSSSDVKCVECSVVKDDKHLAWNATGSQVRLPEHAVKCLAAVFQFEASCKPGAFMYAKTCTKVIPPHPCDPLPPCSLKSKHERSKRLQCIGNPLCYERIKNPEDRKKEDPSCDETK